MTSHLSNSRLQQVTPVLASLARLIASGSQLSEGELQILLYGVNLEYDPEVLKELMIWGRLLYALDKRPDKELRRATAEALMLRGLPEASVLLAIDTVTSGASEGNASTQWQGSTLQVNSSTLDFGLLVPGQTAVQMFDVQGGPGQIIVESDQLLVTPTRFGRELTHIRVEVRPLNGGLLWTSLKLVTREETLEIPVLAQWTDPAVVSSVVSSEPYTPDMPLSPITSGAQVIDAPLELIDMINQALEIDTPGKSDRAQRIPSPKASNSPHEDILDQINRLLD